MEEHKKQLREGIKKEPAAALLQLFLIFLKIGASTIGGGAAMVPFIQVELVERRRWLDNHLFLDYLALAQSIPGPMIVNFAVIAGYRLRGLKGSLLSLLGIMLPSFLIIFIIVYFLWQYRENPLVFRAFQGIRPAVAALIAAAAVKLGRLVLRTRALLLLFALFLGGLIVFKIHPLFVIIAGALAGLFLSLQPQGPAGIKK